MSQEWFRSSFNKVLLFGLILGIFVAPVCSAEGVALPSLLQEVQAQYQKSAGIQAQFSQSTEIRATRQTKRAQGRIWIKKPGKLRWETLEPDPNILVSDGKIYWFYTPPFDSGERGQVIIRKKNQVQTQFLNGLLSGSFNFGKDAVLVSEKTKNIFILKPKVGTAGDVASAEIEIESQRKMISRVTLMHTSGNTTRIELQEISLVSKLEDSLFRFTIDKNTDKIVE